MTDAAEYCERCVHYHSSGRVRDQGTCYRYPPTFDPEYFRLNAGDAPEETRSAFLRPKVFDVDWCGEFKRGVCPILT